MYDSKERVLEVLENIKITARSFSEISVENKEKIIKSVLETQQIPLLSLAMPIILNLANNKNLTLIIQTIDNIISDVKRE